MRGDKPVAELIGLCQGELAATGADADFWLHMRLVSKDDYLAPLRRAIMTLCQALKQPRRAKRLVIPYGPLARPCH
jgi:hypothetical protein